MRRPILLLASLCLPASLLVSASPSAPAPAEDLDRTAPAAHTVGGCRVFPADNPWNRRIDRRPVWRWSSAIVGRQAAGEDLHLDLGTTEVYYGIPVNVVDADQPLLPLQFGVDGEDYGDESDRGPVFVPADAAIEGGSTADPDPDEGDRHVITVRRGTCDLVELYAAERVRDASGRVVAWRAAAAARWNLSSNRLRPAGWTSADAAGLPISPACSTTTRPRPGPSRTRCASPCRRRGTPTRGLPATAARRATPRGTCRRTACGSGSSGPSRSGATTGWPARSSSR
jgi:hypothetical protein